MKKLSLRVLSLFMLVLIICMTAAGCGSVVITFNPDGGIIDSGDETGLYNGKVAVTAPGVSREGYVFNGWDRDFSAPETDITVTALWKKLHTVTFDILPDSAEDDMSVQLTSDEVVQYPSENPVRDGYVFDGWDIEIDNPEDDTVITALWRKLYTVTFNLSGGTTTQTELLTQVIAEGDAATAPTAEKQYMEPVKWDCEFDNITENLEVNAVWERRELTSTEIAKLISPATVEVNTFRRNNVEWSTGSGFFIDGEGTLVTNYHVINDAYDIKVTLDDGTVCNVTHVIAFDKKLDLAILKINKSTPDYLESSPYEVTKGDVIYAIGSSLGLTGTFTTGLVSTVSREIEGQNYIQISAAISSGNSGGPLVDSRGYVIGVNTLSATAGQNLNFSIPVARIDNLKENKMTVLSWFNSYSDLKWWFDEKIVQEINTSSTISAQQLGDGSTVAATFSGYYDEDIYYINVQPTYDKDGKQQRTDLYTYFYIKDYNVLMNTWYGHIVFQNTSTPNLIEACDYDYFDYYEYGDGYLVCVGIYDIFNQNIDFTRYELGFYISNDLSGTNTYRLFMMTEVVTED